MASRPKDRFAKELIESAIAHSKESKKSTISRRPPSEPNHSSVPVVGPSQKRKLEMSQTTPKIGTDFEKIFSRVIGSQVAQTTKPIDYSETYQRAFGRISGDKNTPAQRPQKPPPVAPKPEARQNTGPISTEKKSSEGFSAGYATVFGRLNRDENAESNAKIRESLKKCVEDAENDKKPQVGVTPSQSVFERLSSSVENQAGSNISQTSQSQKDEEVSFAPEQGRVQPNRSVFERLSDSERPEGSESRKSSSGDEGGNTTTYTTSRGSGKSVFERLSKSNSH